MAATDSPVLERDGISSHDSPLIDRATRDEVLPSGSEGTPLNSNWTFWVDKSTYSTSAAEYDAKLLKLYSLATVEKFWSVFNNIPQPSTVGSRCSYHLMREDRKPLWEDAAHSRGGNWKLKCTKLHSDEVWRELLLAAIGEKLTECLAEGDEISGVSISLRERDDVVQIWNTDATLAKQSNVTETLQQLLPNVQFLANFYKAFEAHDAFEGKR